MRALAITGMETAPMMPSIMSGSLIREMPPSARMSAGTRSSAMTATAPASSAILACSGVTTSMITPPLSCSAMPRLTRSVPVPVEEVLSGVSMCGVSPGVATGCCLNDRRKVGAPWYGRSAPLIPGTVQAGSDAVGTFVDVEEAGQRMGGVQPQEPGQPAAAQRLQVPHRVVVEPPGEAHSGGRAGEVGQQRRRDARGIGRQLAQLPAEDVLGEFP